MYVVRLARLDNGDVRVDLTNAAGELIATTSCRPVGFDVHAREIDIALPPRRRGVPTIESERFRTVAARR